jgi:hypothetical protein
MTDKPLALDKDGIPSTNGCFEFVIPTDQVSSFERYEEEFKVVK